MVATLQRKTGSVAALLLALLLGGSIEPASAQKDNFTYLFGGYFGSHRFRNLEEIRNGSNSDNITYASTGFSNFNLEFQVALYDEGGSLEIESDLMLGFPFILYNLFADNDIISDNTWYQFKDPWGDIQFIGLNWSAGRTFQIGTVTDLTGYGNGPDGDGGTGLIFLGGVNSRLRLEEVVDNLNVYPGIEFSRFWGIGGDESRNGWEAALIGRAFFTERFFGDFSLRHKIYNTTDRYPVKANATSLLIGGGIAL